MSIRCLAVWLILAAFSGLAADDAGGVLRGPLVVSDRWPESTSLLRWTRDVMRIEGLQNASETTRARAFFEWLRLFNRMATGGMIQALEGEYGEETSVLDLHKNMFVYGWGFCDTHSRIAEAAWQQYTGDPTSAERVVTMHEDGGFHTMYRLRLDGNYGAFDARYGYFLIEHDTPDARILDWPEVGVDKNILDNKDFKNRSRPFFEIFGREWDRALLVNECWYADEPSWNAAGRPVECVFGNGKYQPGTAYHDMNFRLPKGTTIERFWDNSARMFYVPAGAQAHQELPFRPSGRFYRVTDQMFDGNWPKHDPNYKRAEPYLATVPADEGYSQDVAGARSIGQAWGRITYEPGADDLDLSLKPLDFYSPYVLVEGTLEGELARESEEAVVEIRTLGAKQHDAGQPDVWSEWQALHAGPGQFKIPLGRTRFNGVEVSIHGRYRFQLRLRGDPAAVLKSLRLTAWFEIGIMSIPQIFAGQNTIRFKVADEYQIEGPLTVTYRYQTATGEQIHRQVIDRAEFANNEAVYTIDAPGLIRCTSLTIRHLGGEHTAEP
jgi:hypothetical protein